MKQNCLIKKEDNVPLVGASMFGIIDRGTNVLQVRAITGCPLNCIYCSVDQGKSSKKSASFRVESDYLANELEKIIELKKCNDIEAHIDGMGEPLLNKEIVELIKKIRKISAVKIISMQTNGILLDEKLLKLLEGAGLSRINLSINSMNPILAKKMSGCVEYDLNKIINIAKKISESGIKLLIAPVIVPGFNEEMDELIDFAKSLNALLGIQKYERHKHGRRLKSKEWTWHKFFNYLRELEKKHGIKLILKKEDFGIHKCDSLHKPFKKDDIVRGKVILPGWLSNERIISLKDRLITVFDCDKGIGDLVKAKIVKSKHNIYLAKMIK